MQRLIVLAVGILALTGALTIASAIPASASPNNCPTLSNPDYPVGNGRIFKPVVYNRVDSGIQRTFCVVVGIQAGSPTARYFKLGWCVQDMVDNPPFDYRGAVEFDYYTPGSNTAIRGAIDYNSSDWDYNCWSIVVDKWASGDPYTFKYTIAYWTATSANGGLVAQYAQYRVPFPNWA